MLDWSKWILVMNLFDFVGLSPLMERTEGTRDITVSVIDGPARLDHPAFSRQRIRAIEKRSPAACQNVESYACNHGTFVLGMLAANRGAGAPAICPGCTFILHPIFTEITYGNDPMPVSTPEQLGTAIVDSVSAGALVINLSVALTQHSSQGDGQLEQALNHAAQHGVLVVAAAGNQGTIATSAITRHPWVIPVISCDILGRPTPESNLGSSIGRKGLAAPGENIISIGSDGKLGTFHGTSAAAPFVTGTIALLWSEFPKASAAQILRAVMRPDGRVRKAIAPALLNAWTAFTAMSAN
jgi:subtilisin family serine protease